VLEVILCQARTAPKAQVLQALQAAKVFSAFVGRPANTYVKVLQGCQAAQMLSELLIEGIGVVYR
jgi:hypothetical protein